MARIMIGHTQIFNRKTESPKCSSCGTQLTVKHIIG